MRVSLKPPIEGEAAQRFLALAKQIRQSQENHRHLDFQHLCEAELEWARQHPTLGEYRPLFEGISLVLIDLARLNWEIRETGFGIELQSPPPANPKGLTREQLIAQKDAIRRELEPLRRAQFDSISVRSFIRKLENPPSGKDRRSILMLLADGRELYQRLEPSSRVGERRRETLLQEAIKPYLQLVEEGVKDVFTGIFLGDIWRYLRYSWSIPQTPIPGRQLLYLVRDAAHPCHAVIGIASLNNGAMQVKARDDRIGWSVDGYRTRISVALKSANALSRLKDEFTYLNDKLADGISAIDITHLVSAEQVSRPSEDTIAKLRRASDAFATERGSILASLIEEPQPMTLQEMEAGEYASPPISEDILSIEPGAVGTPQKREARKKLIAKKRALELAKLLQAKLTLQRFESHLLDPERALSAFSREEVQSAVTFILTAVKNRRVGSSMLEITTCGAIPPYNVILGGKLVALLMLSPQVAADYQVRYGAEASIIGSLIKNDRVIRDSTLVYLGTTSLYSVGSSQYHRLNLPAGTIAEDQPPIAFRQIGETSGYGTVQFSAATSKALEDLVTEQRGFRHVNSVFGEGPSPKLRKMSAGLRFIGFDPETLLRHNQTRIIYGASMFPGSEDFLCDRPVELPSYVQDPSKFRDASEKIATFWRARWLSSRLNYQPALVQLSLIRTWKLSDGVPIEPDRAPDSEQKQSSNVTRRVRPVQQIDPDVEFWKRLAWVGSNVTADELSATDLARLHIELPIEEFIVKHAGLGTSIVLTGNAGDGKTHLLRRLEEPLSRARAVIETDATASMRRGSIKPILDAWKKAQSSKRPFCLAANEYPLYKIRETGKGKLEIIDDVDAQCKQRLAYDTGPAGKENKKPRVIVIDLGLRNPLSKAFASCLINKLVTDKALIRYHKSAVDPVFSRNFEQLCHATVQQRLFAVFERLTIRGVRCTVRELWVLIARLLFGSGSKSSNSDQSPQAWLPQRLFAKDPRFPLSLALSQFGDPATLSNPPWDTKLEDGQFLYDPGWLFDVRAINITPELMEDRFFALKRAFFLFHKAGPSIFDLDDPWAQKFTEFLRQTASADSLVCSHFVEAINRCYCPMPFSGIGDAIYLWLGHRFHEQPTRAYIACQRLPLSSIALSVPRLPHHLAHSIEYAPDHIQLRCQNGMRSAVLNIDYWLFAALEMLRQSIPRRMLPDQHVNRLDRFIAQLHRLDLQADRNFISYNTESRSGARIVVSQDAGRYVEVSSLAR